MTREEAIKLVKSATVYTPEEMEALETLIPELAESEDERTRKWLYDYFNSIDEGSWLHERFCSRKEVLAWLEKQKDAITDVTMTEAYKMGLEAGRAQEEAEKFFDSAQSYHDGFIAGRKQKENPKSADSIPSDCVSDAKCENSWHKVADSLPDNPREVLCKDEAGNYFIGRYYLGEGWEISNYDDEDKPHHLNPPVSKWIDFPSEEQKEQKPVAHENIFTSKPRSSAEILRHYLCWAENSEEDCPYTWKDLADAIMDGIKALDEQKPAEWSEEDRNAIGAASVIVEGVGHQDLAKKLKSLCPQPKQEWSEEDELMLTIAIEEVHSTHIRSDVKEIQDWLLNLPTRFALTLSHWKPSEEQMEAFRSYIKDFQEKAEAAVGGWNNFDVMIRLFEQLKRLV